MGALVNRVGEKVGRLTIVARAPGRGSDRHAFWSCDCECGTCGHVVSGDKLKVTKSGTKSCGKCVSRRGESLTQERLKQLLDYNAMTGEFFWVNPLRRRAKIGNQAGSVDKLTGYRRICVDGNPYRAHRLAWLWWFGNWPKEEVDHINRNRADNRLANLREASPRQGRANCKARRDGCSGLKGAFWHSGRWQAAIKHVDNRVHLGTFDTAAEAHDAYCKAARELHGEFFCRGDDLNGALEIGGK